MKYKVIIESEEGDTEEELKKYLDGHTLHYALFEYDQNVLRAGWKYNSIAGFGELNSDQWKLIEFVREELHRYIREHNCTPLDR